MPNIQNKQFTQISLSQSYKTIILGSILGDGSLKLYKPYKYCLLYKDTELQQR